MAQEPPHTGQGDFDPLPGWPQAPAPGSQEAGGRLPSATGWAGTPPWTQPPAPPPPSPPTRGPDRLKGRSRFLRGRRGMAIAGGLALLLVVAVVGFIAVSGDGDGDAGAGGGSRARGGKTSAPAAAAGQDITLLEGRLIVVAPAGWEQRDSSPDTATLKVELRLPGRDLVATLVTSALPAGGTLDGLLTADGGVPFQVDTEGAGQLQGTVVPPTGNIRAAAARPNANFFFTLSVFALDGQPLGGPVLQKLFTDQVAPQIRIP